MMHKFKPSSEGCTLEFLSLVNLSENPVPWGGYEMFSIALWPQILDQVFSCYSLCA